MKSVVLTGGGSAGHVTPNLALVPRLQADGYDVHYAGTANGIERKLVEAVPGVTYHCVRSGKLRRYFSWQNFIDPFRVIGGYFDAKRILKEIKPAAVFSKGGFVSVPVVIAGRRRKLPVILHESDYTPGLANRISVTFATKVLVTFEDTLPHIKGGKGVFTGTPIRPELLNGNREKGLFFCGFDGSKPVLLCMGGSLGAQAINESLREALPTLLKTFDIVHLCGTGKTSAVHENITGYKQFEYLSAELPDVFAASSIAVSRAGANAVFEFLAVALPALLIPLPRSSSRGDQILNADYFSRKGYALSLPQDKVTPAALAETVTKLYNERDTYVAAMRAAEHANGTDAVLHEIYTAIESSKGSK